MELLIRPHPEGELQSIFTDVPGLHLLHVAYSLYLYPLYSFSNLSNNLNPTFWRKNITETKER